MADKKPFAGIAQESTVGFLKQILGLLRPLSVISGSGSNRLSVDVNAVTGNVAQVTLVPTVTTVGTVNNVANQTNIAGVSAFELLKAMNASAYNTGVRAKITP